MVKGCKKSIVYIKNTGSDCFKEAYFILNEGKGMSVLPECDLISEATRVIEESTSTVGFRKRSLRERVKRGLVPFLLGLLSGLSVFFVSLLI